jgi:hypothetical protein
MPGGGGGTPHGCTCSGEGGPVSGGAGTDGACADARCTVAAEPQNKSERAQTALANFVVMTVFLRRVCLLVRFLPALQHPLRTWREHGLEDFFSYRCMSSVGVFGRF